MRHHLVIEKIVSGGEHDAIIDDHEVAPVRGLVDFDFLVLALLLVQLAANPEGEAGTRCIGDFRKPLALVWHAVVPV